MTTLQDLLIYKSIAGEGGGSQITVEPLNATENGIYDAGSGKAYNPVSVDVPEPTLISKSITENGTYNASSDNADGYSSVTVNVPDNAGELIAKTIKTLTIPNGVTTLGNAYCQNCQLLESVSLPNTLTTIDGNAFKYCYSLTTINLPTSLTNLGSSCFQDCSSLAEIVIPSSVTTINAATFISCTSLTTVTIPSAVTKILGNAFRNCTSLTMIKVPPLTQLGDGAFSLNTNMQEYDFTDWSISDLQTCTFGTNIFQSISAGTKIVFATQAIAEEAQQTTNLSTYASYITYVEA